MLLKLVPEETNFRFMKLRNAAFTFSALLMAASLALFLMRGLNLGIDFVGGIMIEVGGEESFDINHVRDVVNGLNLGDTAVQEFGDPTDILIRIERQTGEAEAQQAAVILVQQALSAEISDLSWRRTEVVGPKVSGELARDGVIAIISAIAAILLYIWFRFEWQFGLGAVMALIHDVTLTIGFFALTQLEFNLSIIAAILTIVGYSLNDTVVVYDRIREMIRKYRSLPFEEILNVSINSTLSRTTMTSVTTLIALLSLFLFGPEVIRGFTAAMIWGVFVGTYSSIFVAAPLLMFMKLSRQTFSADVADARP